jgi:multidrug efflux pump subunit AcrA (membrane-fusion protein)
MMYRGSRKPPVAALIVPPPKPPYECYIVGEGLIESGGENYNIGVPFAEVIDEVYFHVGDKVVKGQPLFSLDTRQLRADIAVRAAQFMSASVDYANQNQQFMYYQQLSDKDAVSQQAYTQTYYAKQKAAAQMRVALAQIRSLQTTIERSIICAPFDGIVLQQDVHKGEAANNNPFGRPPFVIWGSTTFLQIRVELAEEDAWRYVPGSRAMAFVRGNPNISFVLEYDYFEPLIVPKKTLTGADQELVDTRVLQIIYRFKKEDEYHFPYGGQLLDVYVETDKRVSPHES